MVQHIATNFTGAIPGVESGGIPLNPKPENFTRVQFWKQSDWQVIRNRIKLKPKDFDAPILSLFVEDEFGRPLPTEVKEEVRGDLQGYWTDLNNKGTEPKNYKELGFTIKEDFRKTMEGKYPWLRLGYGHWKVKQLWINYFPSWKKTHLQSPAPGPALVPKPAPTPDPTSCHRDALPRYFEPILHSFRSFSSLLTPTDSHSFPSFSIHTRL